MTARFHLGLGLLAGGFCALAAGGAQAQPVTGPYVSLGGGLNFPSAGNVDPSLFGTGNFHFKNGSAGLGSLGWGFGNGLRLEFEGNWRRNDFRDFTTNYGPYGIATPLTGKSTQTTRGGMANLLFDFDIGSPYIYPYLGGGIGYERVGLNAFTLTQPVTGSSLTAGGTRGGFAWQGIAGLAFPVPWVVGLSVTAEYRLLGTQRHVSVESDEQYGTNPNGFSLPIGFGGPVKYSIGRQQSALLGLRYEFSQPPAPPAPSMPQAQPAPVASPAPPAPPEAKTYLVFFDWDRADLSERARAIVAEAASASQHQASTRIAVDGYTDLSGTVVYNEALSQRRARAVAAELVRDGVAMGSITVRGHGESNPLVPTAKGVREPQNRRVEIVLK